MQHAAIRLFAIFAWASVLAAGNAYAQSTGVLSDLDAELGDLRSAVRFRNDGVRAAGHSTAGRLAVERNLYAQEDMPEELFSPPPMTNRLSEELPGLADSPSFTEFDGGIVDGGIVEVIEGDGFGLHSVMPPVLSSGSWFRAGRWYVHQDIVMLTRSYARGTPLSVTNDPTNPGSILRREVFLRNDTGSFRFEPGTRMTLGLLMGRDGKNRDHSLEFTFLGLNQWQTSASTTNPAGLVLVTPLDPNVHVSKLFPIVLGALIPGFVGTTHDYSYSADFRSFEVNLRRQDRLGRDQMVYTPDGSWTRHATPRRIWSLLAGMRYINYDEAFEFNSVDTVFNVGDMGSLVIDSQNDMFGFQVGAEWTEQFETWSWGLRGKLGSFVNFADQQTVLTTTPDDAIERARGARDEQLTMLAEFGMVARYQVRPNLALRASYDFSWFQGVALAPEQATFNSASPEVVNVGGNVLLQGGSVGFEWVW